MSKRSRRLRRRRSKRNTPVKGRLDEKQDVEPAVPHLEVARKAPAKEKTSVEPNVPLRIRSSEKRIFPSGERPPDSEKFRRFCEINVNDVAQQEVEHSEEKRRNEIVYVHTSWFLPWELINRLHQRIHAPVVACTLTGLLIVSVVVMWHASESRARQEEALASGTRHLSETLAMRANIENERQQRLEFVKAAHRTVLDCAAAASLEEALPYVLNSEQVRPMMENYYAKRKEAFPFSTNGLTGEYRELEIPLANGSRQIVIFRSAFGEATAAGITVVGTSAGVKIDWEATVGYNAIELSELVKDTESKSVNSGTAVRVAARMGDLYHSPLLKENSHICVELSHPDEPGVLLFGFVDKYSKVGKALEGLLPSRSATMPRQLGFAPAVELDARPGARGLGFSEFAGITVELKPYPEGSGVPSTFFEITELKNHRWIH